MPTGHLALVLHAHLPFVRHPEHEDFLEEDWFFEAITESYIPLLAMMERLGRDDVPFKLTMTVTPTLCAMLQDTLLPLLQQSPEAVRAQVFLGCDSYRDVFHADPAGFWLPECAYYPGLENILREANLRWFVVDAHGLMFGQPRPRRAVYAPCYTPAGPAAFARDRDSSRQVWSATEGYPGDPAYREFYRDIGFELPPEYLWPGSPSTLRKFSGLKYHRITSREAEKELYDPSAAARVAQAHASHFLENRRQQLNGLRDLNFDP